MSQNFGAYHSMTLPGAALPFQKEGCKGRQLFRGCREREGIGGIISFRLKFRELCWQGACPPALVSRKLAGMNKGPKRKGQGRDTNKNT